MGMFKKGYDAVREEKQRQDENREKMAKNIWRFFLTEDGEEAEGRFLTEVPVTFFEHQLRVIKGGKEKFDNKVCSGDKNCQHCAGGDKPTFKGAYLFWDNRPFEYTDKENKKKKGKGQLRLYVQGAKVLSQLDRISNKYGLTKRWVTIVRNGKGNTTSYTIEKGDDAPKLTQAEITNMLPEKLRPMYNGTMESLYEIIEECLALTMDSESEESESGGVSDEEVEEQYNSRKNLVGVKDKKPPVVPSAPAKSSVPMFKRKNSGNSVKPIFKSTK
jgi:hypothetical protein